MQMLKEELRKTIRDRKRRFFQKELEELSLAIIDKVKAHSLFREAVTVVMYHSLPDEVDTRRLIEETRGKNILLPRVIGEGKMELRLYEGPDSMAEGSFHIMEPTGTVFTDYEKIDMVIVPGMAFDDDGHRLGRGRGYYDRFLPLVPRAYKIGVCFGFQRVDLVPTVPTDVQMDEVIS